MRPLSKKSRQWLIGSLLVLACLLVWWVHIDSPLRERKSELNVELEHLAQEKERLAQRLGRLSQGPQAGQPVEREIARYSAFLVEGGSPEEVNARTQLQIQEYLESVEIPLKTYRETSPAKWRDYTIARVELQLSANTQELSDFLAFIESMDKGIRIEKLNIAYRHGTEKFLQVSLTLGTLLAKKEGE